MKRNAIALTLVGLLLLVGLAAALNVLSSRAAADVDAVSAANQLYSGGRYAEATQIYEQLVAQGVQDSTLFYNLGNAHFRQGDLGRAILNYRRAARLAPRDADIKANLERAQAQAVELFPDEATGPLTSLARMTGHWLTLDETAVLALSLWFALGFLALAWRQLGPGGAAHTAVQYALLVTGLLLIFTSLSLGSRIYTERTRPDGVVVADAVALSAEPDDEYTTEFSLTSGAELKVIETNGAWGRVAVPGDAVQGWIPLEAVEMVASKAQRM